MFHFEGMRFSIDVVLVWIRWRVAYPLSYRTRGADRRARRGGRPLVDQPLGDAFPAAYQVDGPETRAPGRR